MTRVVSLGLPFGLIGVLVVGTGCVPAVLTASFTAQPTSGTAPLTVQFTDTSTAGDTPISDWEWDFGDGGSSTDQNPLHTYQSPGIYTVSLTVMAGADSSTETQTDLITVMDDGTNGDPTMVVGILQDVSGAGIEGVPLRVLGADLQGTSGPGGAFSFDDVPSTMPALAVHARTTDGAFFALSPRLNPVAGGVTNVGNLQLMATMPPRFPGAKYGIGDPDGETIAVADYDGDFAPDIAVPSTDVDAVDVFFGRGDGSFEARASAAVSEPHAMAAGDVNRDGFDDFIVSSEGPPERVLVVSNGDGTFAAPVQYDDDFAENVALADLNGDGWLDALASEDAELEIHLNDGAGNYTDSEDYAIACCGGDISVADFNGDGNLDAAVGGRGTSELSVLLGNGDGTFQDEDRYSFENIDLDVRAFVTLDVDSDDDPDIVLSGNGAPANVYQMINDGSGAFGMPEALPIEVLITAAATGDVDNDGVEDIAGVISQADAIAALLLDGQGGAVEGPLAPTSARRDAIALGDFNLDWNLDAVTIVQRYDNEDVGALTVLLGRGDGSFGAEELATADIGFNAVAAGLVDDDALVDIVVSRISNEDGFEVLFGQPNGTFSAPQALLDEPSNSPAILIQPGGGILIVRTVQGFSFLTVLTPDGAGGFEDPVDVQLTGVRTPLKFAAVQMDGAGGADFVLLSNSAGTIGSTRLATFRAGDLEVLQDLSLARDARDVDFADFDGDADQDVVIAFRGAGDDQQVEVFLNDGSGNLTGTGAPFIFPGHDMQTVGAGDFDGDGNADILAAYFDDGGENWFVVQILFGNGDATFDLGEKYLVGDDPQYMHVLDVNGDGDLDAVMATISTQDISVLIGNGDGTFQPVERFAAPSSLRDLTVGDVDGDGMPDVVTVNNSISDVPGGVWLLRQR